MIDKEKLTHDFINSKVIINSLTQSADGIIDTIIQEADLHVILTARQIELFQKSMQTIRNELIKMEKLFNNLCE